MLKLIATISNHLSPLEENILDGDKNIELIFDYYPSVDDVLNKLESHVVELKKGKNTSINIKVINESGSTFLEGTTSENGGFHGISIS
jgi:hypothetical protein